jgi:hypothetical protein
MGPSAGEDLQALVRAWANENPDIRNIRFLERKAGIDYNTASRVWSGKNPECQTALAVLNVVTTKENGLSYLKRHFPHAARFHEREFSIPVFSDRDTLQPLFDKSLSFIILGLAYGGHADKGYIQRIYGEMGLQAANELVNTGKFFWEGEKLISQGKEEFFTFESREDIVKACGHILGMAASGGYPVALLGSLHDDELERFKNLLREFCLAAKELVYSSKAGGKNIIALSTVYVSLLGEGEKS